MASVRGERCTIVPSSSLTVTLSCTTGLGKGVNRPPADFPELPAAGSTAWVIVVLTTVPSIPLTVSKTRVPFANACQS